MTKRNIMVCLAIILLVGGIIAGFLCVGDTFPNLTDILAKVSLVSIIIGQIFVVASIIKKNNKNAEIKKDHPVRVDIFGFIEIIVGIVFLVFVIATGYSPISWFFVLIGVAHIICGIGVKQRDNSMRILNIYLSSFLLIISGGIFVIVYIRALIPHHPGDMSGIFLLPTLLIALINAKFIHYLTRPKVKEMFR